MTYNVVNTTAQVFTQTIVTDEHTDDNSVTVDFISGPKDVTSSRGESWQALFTILLQSASKQAVNVADSSDESFEAIVENPANNNTSVPHERVANVRTYADELRLISMLYDMRHAFPGIESTPGVSGGEPCIVRTRIPVWLLVQSRNLGISESDLLHNYPSLRAEDLANAWAYYRLHHAEIDDQIRENEAA